MVGTKNQILFVSEMCASLCICVCPGTVCVMVLDGSLEKPKWFFKDYMEDDGCRKM